MPGPSAVHIGAHPPQRFRELVGERYAEVESAIARAGELLAGRAVWHVNSTAHGGGVAELLRSLLAYARGAGVDARWAVIQGDPEFFRVTKRIHNHLHDSPGDGGSLKAAERDVYEAALRPNAIALTRGVAPGDAVFLHDPQTAGLVAPMLETGARVAWRCHVGVDEPGKLARGAWDFLRGYVEPAQAYIFSRRQFVWTGLDERRTWIIPPSIDAFSAKNQALAPGAGPAILATMGLAPPDPDGVGRFTREDGTPSRVDRPAAIDQEGPLPPGAPLVTQVSRWDALKDPVGVLRGFVEHVPDPAPHLVLAGPDAGAVADDPEGAAVLAEVRVRWAALPSELRARVHLACLPMEDAEENAAMVNAVQRRSDVVVQKSLAEGFGLTVVEAMWKARPVVASRRGGLQDQVVHGESGLLLDDPMDLAGFGDAVGGLIGDPKRAGAMGERARERVRERFLGTRHLIQYLELLERLLRPSDALARST